MLDLIAGHPAARRYWRKERESSAVIRGNG
jgi:hypothetical protein